MALDAVANQRNTVQSYREDSDGDDIATVGRPMAQLDDALDDDLEIFDLTLMNKKKKKKPTATIENKIDSGNLT
jgi:hypothetical protein